MMVKGHKNTFSRLHHIGSGTLKLMRRIVVGSGACSLDVGKDMHLSLKKNELFYSRPGENPWGHGNDFYIGYR